MTDTTETTTTAPARAARSRRRLPARSSAVVSTAPTWIGLWQAPYMERANDPELVSWVRLEFAMYARAGDAAGGVTGHAPFAEGELRSILRSVNRRTGELAPASRSHVSQAIQTAKARGAVAQESNARCLVIPEHRYRTGPAVARCTQH